MHEDNLKLAIVTGSTREGRISPAIARWMTAEAQAFGGFDIDLLDIAESGLPAIVRRGADPAVMAWRSRIAAADAYVVLVPEYNHSYPAPLKHAIDFAYEEWSHKPVALVSYGGASGGVRAAEHIRGVFSGLASVAIRDSVGLARAWRVIDHTGHMSDAVHVARARSMFSELTWWARALRKARQESSRPAA
jgi:NAD(P)H-dependent FMN reductase